MPVVHDHGIEQRPRQPMPLHRVGIVPRGASVQPDSAGAAQARLAARGPLAPREWAKLEPQLCPTCLVIALPQIAHHEEITESP